MNWDDYRYFLAVARAGQLSMAGRMLGVDHTTVARRIKSLEESLNTKLFDHSPRGYALTRAGQRLVPIAEDIEKNSALARDRVPGRQEELTGRIRIGVPEGVGAFVVSKAALELCEKYPKLRVELVALPQQFSLSKREVDFAITVSTPGTGRLRVQKICDYTLHLYGTHEYLDGFPPVKRIEDLRRLRGIAYIRDLIFDKELDFVPLVDPTLEPHLTSTSVHVQLHAVLNNGGVCILHDFMAERYENLVRLLENEISFTKSFWLIVHEDYADIEHVRTCASLVVKRMRALLK